MATIDDALASLPMNYRLYTVDASIEGSVRVMLALIEPYRQEWFDMGEVLDVAGRDVRPALYLSGIGNTLVAAIENATKEAKP